MDKQTILNFLGKFASWLIWTLVIAILVSLSIFTIIRLATSYEVTLLENLTHIFPNIFVIILFPTAFILVAFKIISIINYIPEPKQMQSFTSKIEAKLRGMSIDKRRSISILFKRLGYSLFIISIIFMVLYMHDRFFGGPLNLSTAIVLQSLFILPVMSGITLISLSRFIMNMFDWAIFYLQEFVNNRYCDDLEKALARYNQILGSTLSHKKILEVSQCINEANKIGKKNEWEKISKILNMAIDSLERKSLSKTDELLIDAIKLSNEEIKKHRETFDFQVKYPLRLKIVDFFRITLSKVFTQFVLFILWIILVLLMISYGWVPNPPPF